MKSAKPTENELKFADEALGILGDFLKFGLKNPQTFANIPNNSYLALLPKWRSEFSKRNMAFVSSFAKEAKSKVVTFVGEKTKKLSVENLVFPKGVTPNHKQKLSNWHN